MSPDFNYLIEELRLAYNNILDLRKHLDSKASTMIATSGTISSILFGFGTFMLTRMNLMSPFLHYAVGILIVALVATAISAFTSMRAFRTDKYDYVMSYSRFFLGGQLNEDVIRGYQEASRESFQNVLIHDYLQCNRVNSEFNDLKVRKIMWAQRFLLVGIMLTPAIVAILFINQIGIIVTRIENLLGL